MNALNLFFINLFWGFSVMIGCVIAQVNRYPNDLAHVSSESFMLITMSAFVFVLGKVLVVIWEDNFKQSFFSQFCERVLVGISPLFVLSGFVVPQMNFIAVLLFLICGTIFFADIGNFWRCLMISKLSSDEIGDTFSWLCIPVNAKSRLGVAIVFFVIYVLFFYFAWRIVGS